MSALWITCSRAEKRGVTTLRHPYLHTVNTYWDHKLRGTLQPEEEHTYGAFMDSLSRERRQIVDTYVHNLWEGSYLEWIDGVPYEKILDTEQHASSKEGLR